MCKPLIPLIQYFRSSRRVSCEVISFETLTQAQLALVGLCLDLTHYCINWLSDYTNPKINYAFAFMEMPN